jgi:hypothetical protein
MLDGLWILQILPPPVASGGIVVLINGKIFGGDSGFTWVGTYRADERLLKGRVHVHNFDPGIKSVLGIEGDYDMDVSGQYTGRRNHRHGNDCESTSTRVSSSLGQASKSLTALGGHPNRTRMVPSKRH